MSINPFDPDKMLVFIEIFPYPLLDNKWEIVSHALLGCNIDHTFGPQHRRDWIMNPTGLDETIVLQIPRKEVLFIGGETFEACMCGPAREKHTIYINSPFDCFSGVMAANDKGRNSGDAILNQKTLPASSVPQKHPIRLTNCQYWKNNGRVFSGAGLFQYGVDRQGHAIPRAFPKKGRNAGRSPISPPVHRDQIPGQYRMARAIGKLATQIREYIVG